MLSLFDGELLSMLPQSSYELDAISLRKGKRPITVVNDPAIIKSVLVENAAQFPKSDVMIAALEPLVGDGILISNGELWRRQRSMLEPAFAQLRVRAIFPHMAGALDAFVEKLGLQEGDVALEAEISALALEIICRTIFSYSLSDDLAHKVFVAFSAYQKLLPQAGPMMLLGYARQDDNHAQLRKASETLRALVVELLETRLSDPKGSEPKSDMLQSILDARHAADGKGFETREIIDQVMVFFLAGHETSASALSWALFIVSQLPQMAAELRAEVERVAPGRPLRYEDIGSLTLARTIFLEALRLYPPAAFLTRLSLQRAVFGPHVIEPQSLVVISPWLVHRHRSLWSMPEYFIPERFSDNRENEIRSGSFIPFGLGPRVCPGRVLAMIEGPYLMAEIVRHFDLDVQNAAAIMPVGRLTIRPNVSIRCRAESVN
jgi:cytochrome P450